MTRTTTAAGTALPEAPVEVTAADAALLDPARLAAGLVSPGEWFESRYAAAAAGGDPSLIPWADLRPNPLMVNWLNAEAPGLVRPGARAVVVGCGLGDDVALLAGRGYDVLGFDASPTAVAWARRRFPTITADFAVADLLDLPPRLHRRFDLVVEAYTIQSVPPALREAAARGVAALCGPRGIVLVIARARDGAQPLDVAAGPPWPLSAGELAALMDRAGLRPLRAVEEFDDDEQPPVRRLRGAFSR